jgi:glutamate-1-semialdehyde aminotransferase
MDAASLSIRRSLARRADELGLNVVLTGIGSVTGIAFAAEPLRHEDDPSTLGLGPLFHLACLSEGILIGPDGILSVSTSHDAAAVSYATARLSTALEKIAELLGSLN